LLEQPFASDPCKPDDSMHRAERIGAEPGFLKRDTAGLFNFGKRAVNAYAKSRRTGNAGPQQASLRVFDARAAAGAAAIDTDKQNIDF
jgi:hypothetical protein